MKVKKKVTFNNGRFVNVSIPEQAVEGFMSQSHFETREEVIDNIVRMTVRGVEEAEKITIVSIEDHVDDQ
ncbi:hypothetical protein PP935_gp221 [Rhizobium phage RHph_N34]|uniref:Uncharacterized protein n=1 Tax=Rhizobium phage RHph_N34 TaxID=2509586 RepID=A0A7S5REE8_9CAUD|nr:hypothetical protein PP935_gp221 [Rhizobium phage RHph_N34]QIG73996.1 hypothetical protein EVC06_221 [Rhizobium phage RHph_N34]